jgi:hypothetical protein
VPAKTVSHILVEHPPNLTVMIPEKVRISPKEYLVSGDRDAFQLIVVADEGRVADDI